MCINCNDIYDLQHSKRRDAQVMSETMRIIQQNNPHPYPRRPYRENV